MSVYDWSTTAASNDVADAAINWAEGMAPSGVNNSARAMMAALAMFVKDTGGALIATGSSNAYILATNSVLTAHTAPVLLAFKANHTSSGAATIAIDGLATKPLKRANGAAIQSGDIVSGSIYLIAYQASADVYYCLNVPGNYDPATVAITGGTINGAVIGGSTPAAGTFTTLQANTSILPDANDGAVLGAAGTAFSDLFLAEGGVINWDSGDLTITQVGNTLTITGGVVALDSGATVNASIILTAATGQPLDADLTTIAGLTATTDNFMQAKSSAWASRTPTQVTADLIAVVADSGSGGTKGLVPAPSAGDTAARKFLMASAAFDYPFSPGHLYGCIISNNGSDATNDIDIATGSALSADLTTSMVLASALTKRLDAAWAVGTNQGGLDTGSIANTLYYVWLIKRVDTGVVDVLFSTSASAPTMPTSYTMKRRVGAFIRSGGAILAFTQGPADPDIFILAADAVDYSTAPGTASAFTITTSAPPLTTVLFRGSADDNDEEVNVRFSSFAEADVAASNASAITKATGGGVGNTETAGHFAIVTNSSGQIRGRVGAAGVATVKVRTYGWIDRRGRLG